MDKENLIISIIIVLCIAAAVAAYGIINNQNAIFSDLASMSPSGSGGPGDNIGNNSSGSGSGSGSGSSGGSGSGSGSGSGGGSGGGSGSGSGGGTIHSAAQVRSVANNHIGEPGCYAGTPHYENGYWYVRIYNSTDDTIVDGFVINDRNLNDVSKW